LERFKAVDGKKAEERRKMALIKEEFLHDQRNQLAGYLKHKNPFIREQKRFEMPKYNLNEI
jgi:hypothetical protein